MPADVPSSSRCALLLVDVINDLEFDGDELLLPHARVMARRLAPLVERARKQRSPVIYANDNFGHWRSDLLAQVDHCLKEDVRGRPIVTRLAPHETDYFVLEPKHSAFYSTPRETLPDSVGAEHLVLAGLAGDSCVLFTAHDAYMREFQLVVPRDCVASERKASNSWALAHMRRFLKTATPLASEVDFRALARKPRRARAKD